MQEQQISYTHTNTYTVLNTLSRKTKNVWFVFHGMGHLSRYFIKHFEGLDPEENFIIALQAPSKYYQDRKFKYVGASWLTKENTVLETKNVLTYVDAVWAEESKKWQKQSVNILLMGYSQGVSIVTRWASSRKMQCNQLLLHSGGIPTELEAKDFDYLSPDTKVTYLYGDKDEYITEARKTEEHLKGSRLFGQRLTVTVFDGIHEVSDAGIEGLVH